MTRWQRVRRRVSVIFWRVVNPPTRPLAGVAPWWVLVETTGRLTGKKRTTPIATGPSDDHGMWLIAVHGRHASWVKNIEAAPNVRVRLRRNWRAGTATIHALDPARVATFNGYARQAAGAMGIDPLLVRIQWKQA